MNNIAVYGIPNSEQSRELVDKATGPNDCILLVVT